VPTQHINIAAKPQGRFYASQKATLQPDNALGPLTQDINIEKHMHTAPKHRTANEVRPLWLCVSRWIGPLLLLLPLLLPPLPAVLPQPHSQQYCCCCHCCSEVLDGAC
jgi:hypothetical protein